MPQKVHINLDPEHLPLKTVTAGEQQRRETVTADTAEIDLCLLPNGTDGGRSVVSIYARLPDGRPLYVELTARNWMLASQVFEAELGRRGEWPWTA
jgi:hypothetical protein